MIVKAHSKDYEISLYNSFSFMGELAQIKDKLVVVDKNVYLLYKDIFNCFGSDEIFLIEASEENKTMNTVFEVCKKMTELDAKRNASIISFGGGITQDLTGFAASILYRGVNWHYVPTTLLAQADSCMGSKTSLNFQRFKNLFGTFYPPNKVYIFPEFLKTLKKDDFLSGLGEVVKFNVMAASEGISRLEKDLDSLLTYNLELLTGYIERSLEFKKSFVEADEFDFSQRKLLNFAHTFGHAIENVSNFDVPHGQAVSIGMIIANRISLGRGLISMETCEKIENLVEKVISVPLKNEYFSSDSIVENMKKDKKRQGEGLAAVIMNENLELELVMNVTEKEVKEALRQTKEILISKMVI
ncbi:MAG: hypothetical protein LBI03_05230 [Clostridiales bacterium]|jgi:3-dehydroquinate synthase|nr:hypothetical protein [Clostridiales bacterium]